MPKGCGQGEFMGARSISEGSRFQYPEDAICAWPRCRKPVGALPICWDHALEAHGIVQGTVAQFMESRLQTVPQDRVPRPGSVYFARFRDRVKIGFSTDPMNRLSAIPHDEVLAVFPGTRLNERQLHTAFADLRITGEWFHCDDRILDFVSDVKDSIAVQAAS